LVEQAAYGVRLPGVLLSPPIQRFLRFAFSVAGALISSVAATEACSCVSSDSPAPCELYKKVDIAFVGRAIHVPPDRAAGRVRFRLTQALKGVAGPEVSVLNQESGMDCGYQFEEGQDYVVFAERNATGAIDIGPCTSTVWRIHVPDFAAPQFRRESAEAVAFAESLRKPATGGRIFGEVRIDVPFVSPDDRDDGERLVDGATITLQGPGEGRRTTTIKGRYEFTGLPRGTYRVSVTMPDGLPPARSARPPEHLVEQGGFRFDYLPDYTRSVTIGDARSCGYAPFAAVFDGEVAGSIVNDDGTPAKTLAVEIFPSTIDPRRQGSFHGPTAYTDSHGAYRFEHLPPGRYIVGINLRDLLKPVRATPYRQPGDDEPSIIELGSGTHIELGVLRLPPSSAKRQIAGTVKWSDGRALRRVRVQVFEDRPGVLGPISRGAEVGADGTFSTELFEGRTYIVKAEAADPRGWWDTSTDEPIPPIAVTAMTIKLDGDRQDLLLVLVPARDRP
jgi:hypothetical protein